MSLPLQLNAINFLNFIIKFIALDLESAIGTRCHLGKVCKLPRMLASNVFCIPFRNRMQKLLNYICP